jgi:hypothetical protein
MPYRISKSCIRKIADVLPDAYLLENGDESVEVVLQGYVDPKTATSIVEAIDEDKLDEYRKAKRQQLIDEVEEIRSFNASVKKRVLAAIVNDAVRSIDN